MGSSFWVTPSGELKIGPVESKLRVIWPDGKTETPLGLNEARPDNEATLYTPTLGLRPNETPKEPPTTRTKGGKELVLERIESQSWLPIQAGKTYSARVAEVRDGGSSPLQADKMILSIGPKLMFPKAKVGDVLQLAMETKPRFGRREDGPWRRPYLGRGRQDARSWPCKSATPPTDNDRLER